MNHHKCAFTYAHTHAREVLVRVAGVVGVDVVVLVAVVVVKGGESTTVASHHWGWGTSMERQRGGHARCRRMPDCLVLVYISRTRIV